MLAEPPAGTGWPLAPPRMKASEMLSASAVPAAPLAAGWNWRTGAPFPASHPARTGASRATPPIITRRSRRPRLVRITGRALLRLRTAGSQYYGTSEIVASRNQHRPAGRPENRSGRGGHHRDGRTGGRRGPLSGRSELPELVLELEPARLQVPLHGRAGVRPGQHDGQPGRTVRADEHVAGVFHRHRGRTGRTGQLVDVGHLAGRADQVHLLDPGVPGLVGDLLD